MASALQKGPENPATANSFDLVGFLGSKVFRQTSGNVEKTAEPSC